MSLAKFIISQIAMLPYGPHGGPLDSLIPPEGLIERHDPGVRDRAYMEFLIIRSAVDELVAAGFTISVDDGEEAEGYVVEKSSDPKEIIEAVFAVDDARFLVINKEDEEIGWIDFVLGNDGFDVLSNHSDDLESHLTKTIALGELLSQ